MYTSFQKISLAVAFVPLLSCSSMAADMCGDLLKFGIRDTQSINLTESRFNEIRKNVCTSSYDSYSKATSQGQSGGLDVPGYFGISGGSSNASTDYQTSWTNFCKSDYSKATSDTTLRTYASTINLGLASYFDRCIQLSSEQFIRYIQPSPDGRTFNISFYNRRNGMTGFTIDQLTLKDTTSGGNLDPTKDCDLPSKLPFNSNGYNAINIVCTKLADHAIIVNGRTTAGLIDVVEVPAVPNPPPGMSEQIQNLGSRIKNLESELVNQGHPSFSYAGNMNIPSGVTLDHFDFSTKLFDKQADVVTGKDWRFIVNRNGAYQVSINFSRNADRVPDNGYFSCGANILRKGNTVPESLHLGSGNFNTTCSGSGLINLNEGDQLYVSSGQAADGVRAVTGSISVFRVGSN